LSLSDQIAHARTLLENGKRMEELIAKRDQLTADLAAVDEELGTMLGPATSANERAPQRCSLCQEIGHSKRTCPTKGAS